MITGNLKCTCGGRINLIESKTKITYRGVSFDIGNNKLIIGEVESGVEENKEVFYECQECGKSQNIGK